MMNEVKVERMKVTIEANVAIKKDSVSILPGGVKILNLEPINNSVEAQQRR